MSDSLTVNSKPAPAPSPMRAALEPLDCLALAYIGLPNLIFLLGWLRPEYGVSAALLVIAAIAYLIRGVVWRRANGEGINAANGRKILVILGIAIPWVGLSGAGHFAFANPDWWVRSAVLVDLVRAPWPVLYMYGSDAHLLMLRTGLGLFLPAATLGKIGGIHAADAELALWCLIGVILTFTLIARQCRSARTLLVYLLVFVFFSGMDVLGWLQRGIVQPFGNHIEWYSTIFQYSSMTTQLYWAPNHALAAWVATTWLLSYRRGTLPVGVAIIMVAFAPLWSPLSVAGMVPLFATAIVREMRGNVRAVLKAALRPSVLVVLLVCSVLIYPYLLLSGASVTATAAAAWTSAPSSFLKTYVIFVLLEFLLIGILLLRRSPRDPLLIVSIVFLLLLPLYRLGPAADLTTRAATGFLIVIALRLGEFLSDYRPAAPGKHIGQASWWLALFMFLIGCFTPVYEIGRTFFLPAIPLDVNRSVIDTADDGAHYIAPRDQPWANRFLR